MLINRYRMAINLPFRHEQQLTKETELPFPSASQLPQSLKFSTRSQIAMLAIQEMLKELRSGKQLHLQVM